MALTTKSSLIIPISSTINNLLSVQTHSLYLVVWLNQVSPNTGSFFLYLDSSFGCENNPPGMNDTQNDGKDPQ